MKESNSYYYNFSFWAILITLLLISIVLGIALGSGVISMIILGVSLAWLAFESNKITLTPESINKKPLFFRETCLSWNDIVEVRSRTYLAIKLSGQPGDIIIPVWNNGFTHVVRTLIQKRPDLFHGAGNRRFVKSMVHYFFWVGVVALFGTVLYSGLQQNITWDIFDRNATTPIGICVLALVCIYGIFRIIREPHTLILEGQELKLRSLLGEQVMPRNSIKKVYLDIHEHHFLGFSSVWASVGVKLNSEGCISLYGFRENVCILYGVLSAWQKSD